MLDYGALNCLHAVIDTGSFERAAARLGVTPSAVSQRVKQLEDRLGTILVIRGTPCIATDEGAWLCRHMEHVGLLETELMNRLPRLAGETAPGQPVTVRIATNADSLGTWFPEALATFARKSSCLFDIAVDDQDHTADWLRRGRVIAAVTGLERPVTGCRLVPLGALRYRATASPDFVARHFPEGVTMESLAAAPALTFNRKDRLQRDWMASHLGSVVDGPTHWLPSTQAFVDACLLGLGWGLNPTPLVDAHLSTGRLVELLPGRILDVPLFWQVSRLADQSLAGLTRDIVAVARRSLQQAPAVQPV